MSHKQVFDLPLRTKPSIRVSKRKGAYLPEDIRQLMERIGKEWNGPKFEGPVWMIFDISAKDKFTIEVGPLNDRDKRRGVQGDASNYLKLVEDALSGYAYSDDKQIRFVVAVINTEPEIVVQISEALKGQNEKVQRSSPRDEMSQGCRSFGRSL